MTTTTTEAARLYRIVAALADELDKDAPIVQALALLRVAMMGEVDQGKLQDDLALSSAGASRTIQALSRIHYSKDRPGFDLVERAFDPADNRRRTIRLTTKGQSALTRLAKVAGR